MPAKTYTVDDLDTFILLRLPQTTTGDEIAQQLSRITINWGRLEQALYWSTRSIDKGKALAHAQAFFSTPVMNIQKKKARDAMEALVEASYPDLLKAWDDILTVVQDVQTRRNLLSHGLWVLEEKEGTYNVHSIKFNKATASFAPPVKVDHIYVGRLAEDLRQVIGQLATIGAEFMAHQQLKKWGMR